MNTTAISPAPALSYPIDTHYEHILAAFAHQEQLLAQYAERHGITEPCERRLLAAFEMTYDRTAVLREFRVRGDMALADWLERNAAPEADETSRSNPDVEIRIVRGLPVPADVRAEYGL